MPTANARLSAALRVLPADRSPAAATGQAGGDSGQAFQTRLGMPSSPLPRGARRGRGGDGDDDQSQTDDQPERAAATPGGPGPGSTPEGLVRGTGVNDRPYRPIRGKALEVGAGILAVGGGVFVGAVGGEAVVAGREVDEADLGEGGGEEVVFGVEVGRAAGDDVLADDGTRKVGGQGGFSGSGAVADDAVLVVGGDGVAVDEAAVRPSLGEEDVSRLEGGVVLDGDVGGRGQELEEEAASAPAGGADVIEEVVADQDAVGGLAGLEVVLAEDVDAVGGVTDHVVGEGDVLDDGPGGRAVLVAHGEEDGEAVLGLDPVVLEEILVDEHSAGVLELEQVLDRPGGAAIAGLAGLPLQGLGEVVLPDLH